MILQVAECFTEMFLFVFILWVRIQIIFLNDWIANLHSILPWVFFEILNMGAGDTCKVIVSFYLQNYKFLE